jgi:TolB-like protein
MFLGTYVTLETWNRESASRRGAPDERAAVRVHSVAVLPLANLGSPEHEQFADEITEALISEIADAGLEVLPYASVMALKEVQVVPDLGVDALLEGSVRRSDSRVRLMVQLIHLPTRTHLYAETYDRDLERLGEVVRDLAAKVRSYGPE